jgi:hypothetical protein
MRSGDAIESIIVNPGISPMRQTPAHRSTGCLSLKSAPGIDRLLADAIDDGCPNDRALTLPGGSTQWHSIGAATNDGHTRWWQRPRVLA